MHNIRHPGCLVIGLLSFLFALFVLVSPNPAFAHAALIAAEPADGAVLDGSPTRFSLEFSEPVSPLVLTLVRPDGTPTPLSSFRLEGQTVEIDAPGSLAKGTHVLSWRVISADGHPVAGSLLFSIGAPSAAPAITAAIDWPLRAAVWIGRVLLFAGLFLGVGGAFAMAWLTGGREGEGFAVGALICGLAAAPLSLGLQGLDALGAPLSHFADANVWQTAAGTTYGWTVLIALAALGLGVLALVLPRDFARPFSLAGLACAGAALAASGHASAASPQWLMRPMVFLHGTGIAFWAGALVPLALTLKRRSVEAKPALVRFSTAIMPVVAVLVLAGIVLAVVQVGTPGALVDTAYGRLLLAKLALLVVLFALAALNRWRLTLPVEAGDAVALRKLVRSIGMEMLIVLAVFGVAAGWRFTPPPRVLAIAAMEPVSTHIHTSKAMADISIAPGGAGPVTASIVIMTGDFGPLDAREVTLVLSKPDSGIGPLKRPAHRPGDGTWRVDDLILPVPGRWTARLDILVSDFDMIQIEGPIDIRP